MLLATLLEESFELEFFPVISAEIWMWNSQIADKTCYANSPTHQRRCPLERQWPMAKVTPREIAYRLHFDRHWNLFCRHPQLFTLMHRDPTKSVAAPSANV